MTYITRVMGGDPATAAIQVSIFEGTCYITPLIGAYLADSLWGRYKTILVFSSIYFLVSPRHYASCCVSMAPLPPRACSCTHQDAGNLLQNGLKASASRCTPRVV